MERLTESSLLTTKQEDPQASAWLIDNVLHPFENGTGAAQLYNNFVSDKNKVGPQYVPEAKTLSLDWGVHTLASASGAVLTYALAGKVAGAALGAVAEKAGIEGTAGSILTSATTGQILGAGLLDFAKAPNQNETRLGNAAGSMAAFGVFGAGNELLGASKAAADSAILTGLGRIAVGATGGLTSMETSHLVTNALGVKNDLTLDDAFRTAASGAFINVAMPVVQRGLEKVVDGLQQKTMNLDDVQHEIYSRLLTEKAMQLPQVRIDGEDPTKGIAGKSGDIEPKAKASDTPNARPTKPTETGDEPRLILLKQQFDAKARDAQIKQVATELSDFVGGTKQSLHAAIYDFRLKDPAVEQIVVDAFNKAAADGKDVKIAFFQPPEKTAGGQGIAQTDGEVAGDAAPAEQAITHGPSPELLAKFDPRIQIQHVTQADAASSIPDAFSDVLGNARPAGGLAPRLVDLQNGKEGDLSGGVGTHGILGGGKLMHNKYMVRDAGTADAAIWTGSTNWTDDAFGSQDNNIIQFFHAKGLAAAYDKDFDQMWSKGAIAGTGKDLHTTVNSGDGQVTVAFSPGDGAFIDAEYAKRFEAAKASISIASMVISSPEVLKALSDKIDQGVPVSGIYDGPQMRNVARAWGRGKSPESAEKLELWNKVSQHLVAKDSTPYSPEGIHDFMHNKMYSVDGVNSGTGSFNISMNATHNAENVVMMDNMPTQAVQLSTYIADLVKTYGGKGKGGGRTGTVASK